MKSGYQGVGSERMRSDRGVCWGQQGWGREGTTARHSPAAVTTPAFLLLGLSLAPSPSPPSTSVFHTLVRLEALSKLDARRKGHLPKIHTKHIQGSNVKSVPPRPRTVHGRPLSPRLFTTALKVLPPQEARETPRGTGEEGTKWYLKTIDGVHRELERNDKPPAPTERLQVM